MKKSTITITILLLLFSLKLNSQTVLIEGVDDILKEYYSMGKFNGTVLLAEKGIVVYNNHFGYKDLKGQIDLSSTSMYNLASLSKIFTSTCIMQLVFDGKLKLDDEVRDILTDLPNSYSGITIQHLLSHTAGVPEIPGGWKAKIDLNNQKVLEFLKKNEPEFQHGKKYSYSNNGFILLALIVEKVSEMNLGEYMAKNIFQKLNMDHSVVISSDLKAFKNNLVFSYIHGNQSDWPSFTYGPGGIYTSAYDLFQFDKSYFEFALFDYKQLNEILSRQIYGRNRKANYGLGWGVYISKGKKYVGHTGSMFGFRNLYERSLDDNTTIIILSNIGDDTDIMDIRNKIRKLF